MGGGGNSSAKSQRCRSVHEPSPPSPDITTWRSGGGKAGDEEGCIAVFSHATRGGFGERAALGAPSLICSREGADWCSREERAERKEGERSRRRGGLVSFKWRQAAAAVRFGIAVAREGAAAGSLACVFVCVHAHAHTHPTYI